MSEIHRYKAVKILTEVGNNISYTPHGPDVVMAADFDRVTAERDALQQRLTKADELVCERTASLLECGSRRKALERRVDVLEGLVRDAQKAFNYDPAGSCYNPGIAFVKPWSIRAIAALKPAEGRRNQCDGCQAGIPVVNGAHRMGKPGGYPDLMSCTAKLYKP